MNKWVKIVIGIALLAVAAGLIYILWWPKPMNNQKNPLDTELKAIHIVHEENGKKIAEIFADSGGYNLKAQTGEANNVRVVLFRDDGSQWTITSPKGTVSDRGEKVTFESPIHAEDQQGGRIDCSGTGVFLVKEKKVSLEGTVVAVQKDITLTGDSLMADINLTYVKVKGKQAKLQKGGA